MGDDNLYIFFRLIHTGAPPLRGRMNPVRWRFVVVVCMGPAIWTDEEDMKWKQQAYNEMLMSYHWPCEGN